MSLTDGASASHLIDYLMSNFCCECLLLAKSLLIELALVPKKMNKNICNRIHSWSSLKLARMHWSGLMRSPMEALRAFCRILWTELITSVVPDQPYALTIIMYYHMTTGTTISNVTVVDGHERMQLTFVWMTWIHPAQYIWRMIFEDLFKLLIRVGSITVAKPEWSRLHIKAPMPSLYLPRL